MGAQDNSRELAQNRNGDRKPAETSDYDPLLPVQYYERIVGGHTPSGEFKLFFAILEDALRCYVRTKNCRSGAKRAEFVAARAWFRTRGTPHVFSFESVCAFLGIDAGWLRARLESMGPSDLPMKQFRTRRRHLARPLADQGRCTKFAKEGNRSVSSNWDGSGNTDGETSLSLVVVTDAEGEKKRPG